MAKNTENTQKKGKINIKAGIYELKGNKFFIDGKSISFLKRKKNIIGSKTENFIHSISERTYISSLYPVKENHYAFDYKNENFELIIDADNVIIKEVQNIPIG